MTGPNVSKYYCHILFSMQINLYIIICMCVHDQYVHVCIVSSAVTPQKAKQILDASLKDGSLPQGYLKVLAAGAARSGKTLSKKHIFGLEYNPDCSSSTGVCEAPIYGIRDFCCQLIGASDSHGVRVITPEDLDEILAHKMLHGSIRGNIATNTRKSSQEDKETSPIPAPEPGTSRSVVSAGESTSKKLIATALCESIKSEGELFRLQVILFLDSGGQPQCYELLPAVSHNVHLVLLFLKLNERLDALCCTAFTDEKGKWFMEQCTSLLTNEEMLVQFVHTMMCKPLTQGEGLRTMFMVIGTHRDLMHECDETLAQKNERLAILFLPGLEDMLIMNGENIIFDVDAKTPDENDEKRYAVI